MASKESVRCDSARSCPTVDPGRGRRPTVERAWGPIRAFAQADHGSVALLIGAADLRVPEVAPTSIAATVPIGRADVAYVIASAEDGLQGIEIQSRGARREVGEGNHGNTGDGRGGEDVGGRTGAAQHQDSCPQSKCGFTHRRSPQHSLWYTHPRPSLLHPPKTSLSASSDSPVGRGGRSRMVSIGSFIMVVGGAESRGLQPDADGLCRVGHAGVKC